jgi:transposase IS116/IS110/IS902 family protein
MIPREYSSGKRQRLGALSKQGNPFLRFLWCEAAAHAVRRDPDLQRFYRRKVVQKGFAKLASRRRGSSGFASGSCCAIRSITRSSAVVATLEEFRRARRLTGGGTHEPATADEVPATGADLDRLYEVLSGLTPSHVRWLYRQRWETCRLNPGQLPLVSDLQYLQTTLKVLDDWRRQGIEVG